MIDSAVPTYYFTQLLAIALGVAPESCRFDLNIRCGCRSAEKQELPGRRLSQSKYDGTCQGRIY